MTCPGTSGSLITTIRPETCIIIHFLKTNNNFWLDYSEQFRTLLCAQIRPYEVILISTVRHISHQRQIVLTCLNYGTWHSGKKNLPLCILMEILSDSLTRNMSWFAELFVTTCPHYNVCDVFGINYTSIIFYWGE